MPGLLPLAALAVGAGAMFLYDPQQGRSRRSRLHDRMHRAAVDVRGFARAAGRDVANRSRGVTSAFHRAGPVSDAVLVSRVRSKIGRYVSNPSAITVDAEQGRVSLGGPVLGEEHRGLVNAAHAVRGVLAVSDRLVVHRSAGGVPALQGGHRRYGERFELAQRRWSPAARALAGSAGLTMLLWWLARRNPAAAIAGLAGAALLLRAAVNQPLARATDRA